MKISKRTAVRIAISYGEIFDYPLTKEEVYMWAPYVFIRSHLALRQARGKRRGAILRRQRRLFAIRRQREVWSRDKWVRARRVAILLKLIPSIVLVGVTGGLARSNARQEDDIDLLIVCAANTLWITRAIATVLLDLLKLRRRPKDRIVQNLICLNMFMSDVGLALPIGERDLFTAHEVLLMTPLWDRAGTYEKFLYANRWVKKFLPKAWKEITQNSKLKTQNDNARFKFLSAMWFSDEALRFEIYVLRLFEYPVKLIQLRYMHYRRTTEVISDTLIRFHPHDARGWIRRALGLRLAKYNIPLDKIFYAR